MLYVCCSSDLPTKIWSCRLHSRPGKACKKNCRKYHVIFPSDYLTHQKHMSFLFCCVFCAFLQVCHCHVSLQVKPKHLSQSCPTCIIHPAFMLRMQPPPVSRYQSCGNQAPKSPKRLACRNHSPVGPFETKKLTLSLGEKKNVERIQNFPLASISSPASVHPDFRLCQVGRGVFSDPKNWGFIPKPTEFWTQGKHEDSPKLNPASESP